MLKAVLLVCSCLAFAIGCGGGGGGSRIIPDPGGGEDKPISELTDAEARDLCEYAQAAIGPMRTVTCDNGQSFELGGEDLMCETVTADELPATCTATVGEYQDCMDAISDDPCILTADTPPPVCAFMADPACN